MKTTQAIRKYADEQDITGGIFAASANKNCTNERNVVRGIAIKRGKVLLTKALGRTNYFLPGGEIEIGEAACAALAREIKEEIGVDPIISAFMGVWENGWIDNGTFLYERNFLFRMRLPSNCSIVSLEPHISFFWMTHYELDSIVLYPLDVIHTIKQCIKGKKTMAEWHSHFESLNR